MSKTCQVIRFEVVRSLKKPSFWLAALLVPILLGFYIFIAALSGYNAGETLEAGVDTANMTLGVFDEAKYLAAKTFINAKEEKQELKEYSNRETGIKDVQNGKLDVFYYLPAKFAEEHKVEIHVKPDNVSAFNDYSTPIRSLLSATALAEVSPINFAVITNTVEYNTTTSALRTTMKLIWTKPFRKLPSLQSVWLCFTSLSLYSATALPPLWSRKKRTALAN